MQQKNSIFADSKIIVQELSNDVSFVIFGHQTWDLEGGGGKLTPPSVSWFSSTPAGIELKSLNSASVISNNLCENLN